MTTKAKKELSPEMMDVERAALRVNEAGMELDSRVDAFKTELQELIGRHLPGLRRGVGVLARAEAEAFLLVEKIPEQFTKPATVILHDVKLGYSTSAGSLDYDDEGTVVKLIEKRMPDRADELIRIEKKLNKDAIKRLPDSDMKTICCRIEGAGRRVLVKRTAGEVDEMMEALRVGLVETILTTNLQGSN